MSDDIPLREWLADRFDAVESRFDRIEKVLVIGNGRPPLTERMTTTEKRLDNVDTLLAYDRQQIDGLRGVTKSSGRWGAAAGAVASIVTAVALAISEAVTRKQ